jgi:ribonucleoside-triphosphate reductase
MEGLLDDTGRITDPYRNFIHVSRYARWLEAENRRETWVETVDRYMGFMLSHLETNNGYTPPAADVAEVRRFILEHKALPSMRALMTAGPALERNNIAGYNCSYIVMDTPVAFDEVLYILMNGTGVGFSAEARYVNKLPGIPSHFKKSSYVIKVDDSKEGWAYAYRELLTLLWDGYIPTWDVSEVREAGARLKTFGGRASGPAPLEDLFRFTIKMFKDAAGRQLLPIEVHDIVCKIASVVVVGGVRRSALISLGDLDNDSMRHSKSGNWWENYDHRSLANNSAVYESKPTRDVFDREWKALVDSGSGERGIFNRQAAQKQAGRNGRRDTNRTFGTNPCSEIILRENQFCNLSTIVVREDDDIDSLAAKVRVATILGTWQSTLTKFKYIRDIWTQNTEEERLLGVSMTGMFSNKLLNFGISQEVTAHALMQLKEIAVQTNAALADAIGIQRAAAITCVKPEGTTSQKVYSAPGLHAWHNDFFLRTVRGSKTDPLTQFLIDAGFYYEDDVMNPSKTAVFYFPQKAPVGAITRNDLSAIKHLEIWLTYQRAWCEHKPSVTINVRPEEWEEVGEWVYENFDELSGVSFLPHSDHTYEQAPYQDITSEEYDQWMKKIPQQVDWSMLTAYELEDGTTSSQDLACSAGGCDVVDFTSDSEAVDIVFPVAV